ncbi:MAG: DNA polymerase [Spirochaetia bacterium]|nr:DNA polymerase [Spirochaetia bacterium]
MPREIASEGANFHSDRSSSPPGQVGASPGTPFTLEGHIFDIYHLEDVVHVWVIDKGGKAWLIKDVFMPGIFVAGNEKLLQQLTHRLNDLGILAQSPRVVEKLHFYRDQRIPVLEYRIQRPHFLRTIHTKLYEFFEKLDIYHSDIELTTHYMLEKGVFPLAAVRVFADRTIAGNFEQCSLRGITALEPHESFEYSLPTMRILRMSLAGNYRLGVGKAGPLIFEYDNIREEVMLDASGNGLDRINDILSSYDPDVILSAHGDQTIFPALFAAAQECGHSLLFDRDPLYTRRKIVTKGTSYLSYGSVIYRAPSYPLFGRWHIDSFNSFVFRESRLAGIIELARLSRLPVQRLARSSTGTAMTAIQTEVAIKRGYLVPWQKSRTEKEKSALELLTVDKGGLVYEPDIRSGPVHENVIQIDYSQMYPSIMVNHNISPETVSCDCCSSGEEVPESVSWICRRRRGIVPEALAPILARRRYLKKRLKETVGPEHDVIDERQSSLKWLLVTSFGYLGYRNAKFGKLESHEAVTAFGRDKLLRAKELAEQSGYTLVHAITDCLFIKRDDGAFTSDDDPLLLHLLQSIYDHTGIEIVSEGTYSWIVFVPSRQDSEMPVATKYFGRLSTGSLKIRGIAARRKDTTPYMKQSQMDFLNAMITAEHASTLRMLHPQMDAIFSTQLTRLYDRQVNWKDLLIRRTATRAREDYEVAGAAAASLNELAALGIETTAGEKVRYLLGHPKERNPGKRYIPEESVLAGKKAPLWSPEAYHRLLLEVYREVWEHFAPAGYFGRLIQDLKESLKGEREQGRFTF